MSENSFSSSRSKAGLSSIFTQMHAQPESTKRHGSLFALKSASSKPKVSHHRLRVHNPNYVAKTQYTAYSCGAASLLCLAKELGVTNIPAFDGSFAKKNNKDVLLINKTSEIDLYTITSNGMTGEKAHKDFRQYKYSLPDGVATAARMMNLNVQVYQQTKFITPLLNSLYNDAKKRVEGSNIKIQDAKPALKPHERAMIAVIKMKNGLPGDLHWLMLRPDGSVMDPALGENIRDLKSLNTVVQQQWKYHYSTIGITMVFSAGEQNDEEKDDTNAKHAETSSVVSNTFLPPLSPQARDLLLAQKT